MRRLIIVACAACALMLSLVTIGRVRAAGPIPVAAMGPHMEVTLKRAPHRGDQAKADAIIAAAKAVMAQYPTVEDVERAGFVKFLPHVPLPIEHYTSASWGREAWYGTFDPMHPTSLIFRRAKDNTLTLVGVMYTASTHATEEQLDADVPLSIAQWHRHVNYCMNKGIVEADPRFGMGGSIDSPEACAQAGGRWVPQVFGWMVHVWPLETEPAKIWAVDQHDDEGHTSMGNMKM